MWGLNMHQARTFREAAPHEGHQVLRRICQEKGPEGWFVWTSNVDGQHQLAGFDAGRVFEVHGQMHRLQCTRGRKCGQPEGLSLREEFEWRSPKEAWVVDGVRLEIPYDSSTYRVSDVGTLPQCGRCGSLARPNIWFCSDKNYVPWDKNSDNSSQYQEWRRRIAEDSNCKVVVIECGGGTVIPSVRCEGEMLLEESEAEGATFTCTLVRINPSDYGVPAAGAVGIPLGAAEGLRRIDEARQRKP